MKPLMSVAATLILIAFIGLFAISCNDNNSDASKIAIEDKTIQEIIASDTSLSIFNEAISIAGINPSLINADSNFTVFAPSNAACRTLFKQLGISSINNFLVKRVRTTLLYHVLRSKINSADLKRGYNPTLNYYNFNNKVYPLSIFVDSTDSGITINNVANIVVADIQASNGCIHIINGVLYPPDIFRVTASNPNFSILAAAIAQSGLTKELLSNGNYTIFAPDNKAFENYFAENGVKGIESFSPTALAKLLLRHTISGFYPSMLLQNGSYINFDGKSLLIKASGSAITIDSAAKVIIPNIISRNGVVYSIDKVLAPPQHK